MSTLLKTADWLALAAVLLASWTLRDYLAARREAAADLLALNNTATSLPDVLVFNRVPKVGSQTLWTLLDRLAGGNGFVSCSDSPEAKKNRGHRENNFLPGAEERRAYFDLLFNRTNGGPPFSYAKHLNYLDFEEFLPGFRPIYVNLVRDPVERVVSWYYYVRAPWYNLSWDRDRNRTILSGRLPSVRSLKTSLDDCVKNGDPGCVFSPGQDAYVDGSHSSQVSFFCGHDPDVCSEFGGRRALARAVENVERRYAVVGVTEHFERSLEVMEALVPAFFAGASRLYSERTRVQKVNENMYKPGLSEEARAALRRNFTVEYEFYHFCRQRLDRQYRLLKL